MEENNIETPPPLEQITLSWGENEGNKLLDEMVRQTMRFNGVSTKDIHVIKKDSDEKL